MTIDEPSGPVAIQARWREALRQLAESAPGSPENERLASRVRDLAADYRAAIEAQPKQSGSSRDRESGTRRA